MEPVIVMEDTVAALDKFTDETVRSEWCSGHKQFLISKHAHVPRPCHGLTRSPQSVQCFGNWDWCREYQEEPSFIQHCSDSGDRVTVVFWTQTISYFQARTFPATMPWVGMQSTECAVFWESRLVSWMPRRTVIYSVPDMPQSMCPPDITGPRSTSTWGTVTRWMKTYTKCCQQKQKF